MDLESHSGSATYYLIWLLGASVFLHTAWNLGEIVVLKKILESPLDCKEIKSVNPKWNQPRIFIGRTDAEAEAPILCHLMRWADSLEKTLMLGKIEGRRRGRQRMRMVGWHHRLDGHEFEQTVGDSEGQGSLVCCSSWGCRIRYNSAIEKQHCIRAHLKPVWPYLKLITSARPYSQIRSHSQGED